METRHRLVQKMSCWVTMNHRDAEDTEKKKRDRVSPHLQSIGLFAIALVVYALIAVSLGIAFHYYNLGLYEGNRRNWDERDVNAIIVVTDELGTPFPAYPAEQSWTNAASCLESFFCNIKYNEEYKYPEYIEDIFEDWQIKVIHFELITDD
jgi:hypothetical protein